MLLKRQTALKVSLCVKGLCSGNDVLTFCKQLVDICTRTSILKTEELFLNARHKKVKKISDGNGTFLFVAISPLYCNILTNCCVLLDADCTPFARHVRL